MILEQTQGIYPAADVLYYGFGSVLTFISGPTTPTPSLSGSDHQFLGEIQQIGFGSILDASIGIT